MDSLDINKLFREKKLTLGSVESFTGGLFAHEITRISGASNFYKGALVTYATEEKMRILGISQYDVNTFGVVSQEVAGQMATRGKALLNVDYCVSFTGNAGPNAMEGKPVGEVYIGVCGPSVARVYKYQLKGSREAIQFQAVEESYRILQMMINEKK